jgi:hypothetical protein
MTYNRSWDWFAEPTPSWDEVGVVKPGWPRKRVRKPRPEMVAKRALAAGLPVSSYTHGDVTVTLGEPVQQTKQDDEVEEWIKKHAH